MHNKKLFGTATVGTKGQIVIPAEARDEMDIQTGDKLYVVGSCKSGFVGLLKEDTLEKYIDHINLQAENLKSIKKSRK